MKNATDIGMNRTGVASTPLHSQLMKAGASLMKSTPRAGLRALAAAQAVYAPTAEPIGTMPPPASLRQASATVIRALRGEKATVFIDKLSQPGLAAILVSDPLALRRAACPRILRSVADVPDSRMDEAIDLLRSKQQPDGTWLLENTHRGKVHFALEDGDGRPSRWNTLRTLLVLSWCEQSAT